MWPFLRRSTLDAHPERLIDRAKQGVLCARHKLVLLYVHLVWAQSTVSLIIKIHTHCKIHIGVTYYLINLCRQRVGCVCTLYTAAGRPREPRTYGIRIFPSLLALFGRPLVLYTYLNLRVLDLLSGLKKGYTDKCRTNMFYNPCRQRVALYSRGGRVLRCVISV
jgi:hypothetical protein